MSRNASNGSQAGGEEGKAIGQHIEWENEVVKGCTVDLVAMTVGYLENESVVAEYFGCCPEAQSKIQTTRSNGEDV